MHPIERLRYVARAGSAPDRVLVAEAVPALGCFADDPGALLIALRQLIVRQPESAGLVVLGARMLTGMDPIAAAWELAEAMEDDPTEGAVDALVGRAGSTVDVIGTIASGSGELLCPAGTGRWIDEARAQGRTVVGVTPLGSRLPQRLWEGYVARAEAGGSRTELIAADRVDDLIGPEGDQAGVGWSPDCSDVVELASF